MESTGNNCRIELTDSICPVNNIQFPLLGQESTPTPAPTIATSNCPSSMYVLSTENISQLLKSWKRTPQNTKSSSSSSCTTDYNDINKNTHDDNKGRHNDYSHLESILPFNHNLEEDFGTRWNAAELEMEIDGVFCWLLVLLEDMDEYYEWMYFVLTIKCSLSIKSKMQKLGFQIKRKLESVKRAKCNQILK